jgi:hypothetical protein
MHETFKSMLIIWERCGCGYAMSTPIRTDLSEQQITRVSNLRGKCFDCGKRTQISVKPADELDQLCDIVGEPVKAVDPAPIPQESGCTLEHVPGIVDRLADTNKPPEGVGAP